MDRSITGNKISPTMKKKPGKYLKFYLKSVRTGIMPITVSGLCDYFTNGRFVSKSEMSIFDCLRPTEEDKDTLHAEGKSIGVWGSDCPYGDPDEFYCFNDLRQNLVLLGACMNNEL